MCSSARHTRMTPPATQPLSDPRGRATDRSCPPPPTGWRTNPPLPVFSNAGPGRKTHTTERRSHGAGTSSTARRLFLGGPGAGGGTSRGGSTSRVGYTGVRRAECHLPQPRAHNAGGDRDPLTIPEVISYRRILEFFLQDPRIRHPQITRGTTRGLVPLGHLLVDDRAEGERPGQPLPTWMPRGYWPGEGGHRGWRAGGGLLGSGAGASRQLHGSRTATPVTFHPVGSGWLLCGRPAPARLVSGPPSSPPHHEDRLQEGAEGISTGNPPGRWDPGRGNPDSGPDDRQG